MAISYHIPALCKSPQSREKMLFWRSGKSAASPKEGAPETFAVPKAALSEDEHSAGAVLERQGVGLRIVKHDPVLPVLLQLGTVPCQQRRGEDGELLLTVAGNQGRVGERGGAVVVSLFMPSILSFLKS